jgi:hypothetical protein
MTVATSRIPAAINALFALLTTALADDPVTVVDGPPIGMPSEADYLYVGWQLGENVGAEMRQDFAYAGARRRDEEFDILCQVDAWTGDDDVPARRQRAFDLLAVVEDALRATDTQPTAPNLSGAVLWSHITQGQLTQTNSDSGVAVRIPFRITCRARL